MALSYKGLAGGQAGHILDKSPVLTFRDQRPHMLIFILTGNLESSVNPINLPYMSWTVGRSRCTEREHTQGEQVNATQKGIKSRTFLL